MNNTVILLKCIAELEAEKPRLDFVLGALATLVEMQGTYTLETGNSSMVERGLVKPKVEGSSPSSPASDEAALLDARAKAALETIKAMENTTE